MKKILLSFLLAILMAPVLQSQCVIDTTITDILVPPTGSRFDTLPSGDVIVILPYAYVQQNYSEVLQFKVPKDTTYLGIAGTVDSIVLMNVLNLPAGLSLSCNPGNCVFPGGTYGCGEMSGIPTVPDSIELEVAIEYTVTIGTASAPIKDTLGGFYLVTRGQIGDNELAVQKPRLYPNPAGDYLYLDPGTQVEGSYQVRILNLIGSQIYQQSVDHGHEPLRIGTSALRPGVYIYQLSSENKTYSGKFSIVR